MTDAAQPYVPSWLRWPPNCCETCTGWQRHDDAQWTGTCNSSETLEPGITTDTRYRCPAFKRRSDI